MLEKQQKAGCVHAHTHDDARFREIAENIREVQASGHYGVRGNVPPLPLHRGDSAQIDPNRRAVCGGKVLPPQYKGMSCDEYPFASTQEGGTTLPPIVRDIAWVPVKEQKSQGGLINKFYVQNRVLVGDEFWVEV
jgi:hypothetical protein